MSSRSIERGGPQAGFTLIEVLVALAVVAISLTAIGSLVATNIRTTRALDDRLELVSSARAILAGLPERDKLTPGNLTGELAGRRWRVDVRPFVADFVDPTRPTPWVPQIVTMTLESPGGRFLQVNTVRLNRVAAGGRQ